MKSPKPHINQDKHQKIPRKKLMLVFFVRVFYHFPRRMSEMVSGRTERTGKQAKKKKQGTTGNNEERKATHP
jgi:hypothetical protein